MKKVILISAAADYPQRDWSLVMYPPLGILALGSYLDTHDVPFELIDMQMDFGIGLTRESERIVCQRVARYLRDQAGAIAWVGISQLSNAVNGITLAQEIRAILPDLPIILGGYFPSSTYQFLLQKYPFITAIVRGDGEATALHISQSLDQGQSFLSDQTPNLVWRDGDEIRINPLQTVALDNLPIMNYRLLRNASNYQALCMMTSWGCPFQCNYCLEDCMRPYTAHSPSWVAQQLAHLEAELSNRWMMFADPVFGVNRRRTLELCQVMRDRPFTYGVESRVGVLTPDLIPVLRQAGVEAIFWGIESASTATLLRMNKVRSAGEAEEYLRKARELLKACFENDVTPFMGVMAGFPGDSEADLQATLDFVKELSQLSAQVAAQTGLESGFVPAPLPTKIYDGAPLTDHMRETFPEVVLRPGPLDGESTVLSPSPGLDLDMINHYLEEIEHHGHYTPLAFERIGKSFGFSVRDFLAEHPELMDDQGVTVLGDSLRRFTQ
jgi:hypothetical protein